MAGSPVSDAPRPHFGDAAEARGVRNPRILAALRAVARDRFADAGRNAREMPPDALARLHRQRCAVEKRQVAVGELGVGEVGYLITGVKDVRQSRVGDTVTRVRELETVREFMTSASLTVLVDPLFTIVFLIAKKVLKEETVAKK